MTKGLNSAADESVLINPSEDHFATLLTWVGSYDDLVEWGGPDMNHPTNDQCLKADLCSEAYPSFSLVSASNELLAFGQCYLRLGRCHLCRLIVSPSHRGEGIIKLLIEKVSLEGRRNFNVNSCSLFVYETNVSAIKAYLKLRFSAVDYPEENTLDNCLYMVKSWVELEPF